MTKKDQAGGPEPRLWHLSSGSQQGNAGQVSIWIRNNLAYQVKEEKVKITEGQVKFLFKQQCYVLILKCFLDKFGAVIEMVYQK